jgi:hypothetical protein
VIGERDKHVRVLRGSAVGLNRVVVVLLVFLMTTSMVPLTPVEAAETSITLRDPVGGEELIAGSVFNMRWQVTSTGGYVAIYLSTDGGERWTGLDTILNMPDHSFGYYDWNIPPNLESDACKVRVVWRSSLSKPWDVYGTDESASNFTVVPGVTIHLTQMPSLVSFGRYYLTTFDLYDPHDLVDHLSVKWRVYDGGWGSWEPLPGMFDDYDKTRGWIWWSPGYYESAMGEMRVEAIATTGGTVLAFDESDQFTIVSPATFLIQPNGGVTLVAGSTYTIKWHTSEDPEQVLGGVWIRYSLDGGDTWPTVAYTENDFEHDWVVPSSPTDELIIQVISWYGEWYTYASDMSDDNNRIIASASVPSVTLDYPNPPIDGGIVMGSGEVHKIQYTLTGSTNINSVAISYSTNNGTTWTPLATHSGKTLGGDYAWTTPAVDSYGGRVRLVMSPRSGSTQTVISNNAFYIFDTIEFNRPPVAMAGDDQEGNEGDTITLDGTGSYDPDGDGLTYSWTQIEPSFMPVTLSNPAYSRPTFTVSELHHFPVTFVFELEVSDPFEHTELLQYNTDRVTIVMQPNAPEMTSFWPHVGWEGTYLRIEGHDLMGAEILFGSTVVLSVPTSAVVNNPDPDHSYSFRLPGGLPLGEHLVAVRTMMGTSSLSDPIEIFPVPQWQYDNGLGFGNPSRERLNYPWNPFGETGRYRDVFGNQVYLTLWVCIGIPYWTPWDGWECLGYLIDEPFCPDPLAAILYPIAFMNLADNGECFGMSMNALRFYHGDQSISEFDPPAGATTPGDLVDEWGTIRRTVDWRQGSQIASEVLNKLLLTLINGLIPSSDVTGMGTWIQLVKSYIDSGELGIASMICGEGAHAVVPYAYEETSSEIRFYVYDPNRPAFSSLEEARNAANLTSVQDDHFDVNNHPPYIRIEKSGVYWSWEFDWPDGTLWTSDVGLAYVPYNTLNGDRTIPTSVEGILHLLSGSAVGTVEDGSGGQVGIAENGSIMMDGIEGAVPLPSFSGKGDLPRSWFLPQGEEYTAHINGLEDGHYLWGMLNNGSSGLCIEGSVSKGAYDDVKVDFDAGISLKAAFEYSTTDEEKPYTGSIVHEYGVRSRNFTVRTTLTDTGPHTVGTNGDYSGLVFTNGGTEPCTITVEFTGNVLSEDVWNGTSPPVSPVLPSASRSGIVVGPGETIEAYPTSWLDLNNAVVLLTTEDVPGAPEGLVATEEGGAVTLTWDPPADTGGLPISQYTVLRGDSAEDLADLDVVDVEVGGTTYMDDSVERNLTYYYAVTARNLAGLGLPCEAVSVTVPPLTAPGSPVGLNVTEEEGVVTITWEPPADDGGSPVTGYAIMRGTDPGNMAQLAEVGLVSEYEDTEVKAGKTYYYQVRAVNAIGDGTESPEASVKVPKEEPGDGGTPWLLYVAVIIIIVILVAVVMMMRGKRGGPEASAPMGPEAETEAEKSATPVPAFSK